MNYTSRTDENILLHPTWNQNPPPLTPDLTTRQDFNGIVNAREQRDHTEKGPESFVECNNAVLCDQLPAPGAVTGGGGGKAAVGSPVARRSPLHFLRYVSEAIAKYFKFVGPGFMIAVAYIDPGNYATDVSAGAETKFALLFIVFASNLIAILLQSLCIKLGSVTGLDLAQNCRAHFPRWLVIIIYIFAEAAIIVTDISEVRLALACFLPIFTHRERERERASRCPCCKDARLTGNQKGHWSGHFPQLALPDPFGSRMLHHTGRHAPHYLLLSTDWVHDRIASIRVIYSLAGVGSGGMLLHPALLSSRHHRGTSFPRLSSVGSGRSRQWVRAI